ncbi:hypothetical protein Bpfe_027730 [Biomphalaria pfeifferi]|uniref:Uncharacterized protein n=1 Tax=Biomphalaria pfeifferi TaxID=112525 RepID=A0AAD8EXK1_BIOPF|nr:hypothetical protein Bpfe_027730 [Biomphalaria pfeifferi]
MFCSIDLSIPNNYLQDQWYERKSRGEGEGQRMDRDDRVRAEQAERWADMQELKGRAGGEIHKRKVEEKPTERIERKRKKQRELIDEKARKESGRRRQWRKRRKR